MNEFHAKALELASAIAKTEQKAFGTAAQSLEQAQLVRQIFLILTTGSSEELPKPELQSQQTERPKTLDV